MLLTIFKYLWLLPLSIVYIVWTIKAVKALVRFIIDRKKYKVLLWDDNYEALFIWIAVHIVLLFSTSLVYFLVG